MKVQSASRSGLLARKVPLPYFLMAILLTLGIAYAKISIPARSNPSAIIATPKDVIHFPGVRILRNKDYAYTRPLILADLKEEAPELNGLRNELEQFIAEKKASGDINSAAVYIRKMADGKSLSINGTQPYNPGSTAKLTILLTYLKESEKRPKVLDEQLSMTAGTYHPIKQFFPTEEIVAGKAYTIRQLLYFMIVKSSNSATGVLTARLNQEVFNKIFSDLDLAPTNLNQANYMMSPEEISRFMRVLYNASYVNAENSDYALSLLAKAEFDKGIISGLPSGTKVVHKFGEQGDPTTRQLHETAIVYLDDNAYLLTIMTKGNDMDRLPAVLSEISRKVYNHFNSNS